MAITSFGIVVWLTNGMGTFVALVKDTFREFLDNFRTICLDDILVYSQTREEHIVHVRKSFKMLRKHKIYAKVSKCTFEATQTEHLGYILKGKGIYISPHKTEAIEKWPTPQNKRDVQSC